MITSKQRSLIGLAAVLAIASTQACGSDDNGSPNSQAGAPGAAGAHAGAPGTAGAAPIAGAPGTAGAAPIAGAPAGGAPGAAGASAGAPSSAGGGAGGTGGASAGSGGGSTGGSAGKGGGGSGGGGGSAGGGSTATFAQVTTIINSSCATGMCHNATSGQLNFKTPSPDLYTVLTTAIPSSVAHCKGTTLVVPSNAAGSFLASVVKAKATCKNNGADESIARMPDNCNGNSCLSTAQIATISDWINAGAPK